MSVFLKLDDVEGESTHKDHEGEIEVLSWALGLSSSGTTHLGGGGAGTGKVRFNPFSITKKLDRASPVLMLDAASGRRIPTATLTGRKAGEGQKDFLRVTMKEVLITACDVQGTGDDDDVQERLDLSFARISVVYSRQQPDGSMVVASEFGWDVARNSPI